MKYKCSSLLRLRSVRYLMAGAGSYAIELSFLYSIILAFGTSQTTATAIAFWIGLVTSFLLQKLFAFSNKSSSKKGLSKQAFLYVILVIINYIFTVVLVYLFRDYEVAITRTIALIITTLWNFFIYKHLIFKLN